MSAQGRRLVLVSGAPGSGKTTLAVPLAAELGFALLRKDRIKETPDLLAEYDPPVGLGDLVTVDTTIPVDIPALADRVRASLRAAV
jgi:broad-specificity NMP kinase